jgi:superfamily II DNA or RNA helicase
MKTGLYEKPINKKLNKALAELTDNFNVEKEQIDSEEAAGILSKYVKKVVERSLNNISESDDSLIKQIELVNKIIGAIKQNTGADITDDLEIAEDKQLLSVTDKTNTIQAINDKVKVIRPVTSIAQSSLFTGAVHEPQMFSELKKEIFSCNCIDMLVSFIKWSGLRLLMEALTEFTNNGGKLRIITTSYMGATDIKAISELAKLKNTEIKVSYDTKRTRLHAKAYIFYRETGFTTAYIGSSNLSNVAISSGLEWNIKITRQDQPEVLQKVAATFDSYNEFEVYDDTQKPRLTKALQLEKTHTEDNSFFAVDINPYPYQQEILDKLEAERTIRNNYKNLIVAATGTGKTIISALDYKHECSRNSKPKLLFVAHRKEILEQSIKTFRMVLRDANFGDLFVGDTTPQSFEHLFVSVQTFNAKSLEKHLTPDFYDYIIIDEVHHAPAETYKNILGHFTPKFLLGLTATPERMDGKSIMPYFNNKITAEIRLPEAIERKLLCPFQYFGVTDNIDLSNLRWERGGYNREELSKIYTRQDAEAIRRASLIVQAVDKYVTDINEVKGLGFCVSKEHARFMADYFNKCNIPSLCLTGDSPKEERDSAKLKLTNGDLRFIFVVDLYNEGVDIVDVNTILFLRPTESLTIFLQQLGRGLRLADGKECLTVLDFIGQANKKYDFESKFKVLLSNTDRNISNEIKNGFISAPKGCYIQLEKKAQEYVLENIRTGFDRKDGLIARIASFTEDTGKPLTLTNFVEHYELNLQAIYKKGCSFARLCVLAGKREDFSEELESDKFTKALARVALIDSRHWIEFILNSFANLESLKPENLSLLEKRMLRMLQFTIWQKDYQDCGFSDELDGLRKIKGCKVLYDELIELLKYSYNKIDFIDKAPMLDFDCPLNVYCNYSRDQIFAALDVNNPLSIREGVKFIDDKKLDVLLNTLNKSSKQYSPTTMYNDYSINEWLFHWQSQSTTSAKSPTGQRYINHKKLGSKVLLFVRENKKDMYGNVETYTFLGTVNYVRHDGSNPMNIIWKLDNPIPAKFLKKTNKLVI